MTVGVDNAISKIKTELNSGKYAIYNQNIKNIVKNELGLMLSSGEITKKEAKEVKKFFDYNMRDAIEAKYEFQRNEQLIEEVKNQGYNPVYILSTDKDLNRTLQDTGLTLNDLVEVGKLAGDDFTINRAKLTKAEKKAGKAGKLTRSEIDNIQNALNAKIKENGYTKELSKGEVLTLMKHIGINDGVTDGGLKALLGICLKVFTIAPMIYNNIQVHGSATLEETDLYMRGSKYEKAYGEQPEATNGSATNRLEAKMHKFDVEY